MIMHSISTLLVLGFGVVHANIGRGTSGHVHVERGVHHHHHHHHHHNRGLEGNRQIIAPRAAPSTEADAAAVKSSKSQCTPYYLESVNALVPSYPSVWEVANIVDGDNQAQNIYNAIQNSNTVPNIKPRGTPPSSYSGANLGNGYDNNADPDCWWTATTCTTPKHSGVLPDITTCDEPHTWGYTFDDGPNCTHNALYDAWAKAGQKVSLMYIGSNVIDWPLQAQRGIADGHHICAHTWSHNYMTSLTNEQAFAELYYTVRIIKDVMGITVTCWRPPYGDVDDRIRAIAQGLGLRTYMWSGNTNDWDIAPFGSEPTASIKANYNQYKSLGASKAAKTGGIIVLNHENNGPDMKLAIKELISIRKSWKHVVPISACLNVTKPYAENIVYPNFRQYIGGKTMPKNLPKSPIAISNSDFTPQGSLGGGSNLMTTNPRGGPQK